MMVTQPQNLILSPFSPHPLSLFPSSLSSHRVCHFTHFGVFTQAIRDGREKRYFHLQNDQNHMTYEHSCLMGGDFGHYTIHVSSLVDVHTKTWSRPPEAFRDAISRRKFCGANFAGFAGYTILSIWQNPKSSPWGFEPTIYAVWNIVAPTWLRSSDY